MAAPLPRRPAPALLTRPTAPTLTVVPTRRRVAGFVVTLMLLVSAVLVGALGVHTRIAERQLRIDDLERSVRDAEEEFDVLRAQRAQLRSPTRLAERAAGIGMVVGSESEFVAIDPMVLATTIARTGHIPTADEIRIGGDQELEPLDQFRLVKQVTSEAP